MKQKEPEILTFQPYARLLTMIGADQERMRRADGIDQECLRCGRELGAHFL